MIPRLQEAKYLGDYRIRLVFADGAVGEVDFQNELHGELFEPLRDKNRFRQFSVHPEFKTLTWTNGADIAAEFLYEKLRLAV